MSEYAIIAFQYTRAVGDTSGYPGLTPVNKKRKREPTAEELEGPPVDIGDGNDPDLIFDEDLRECPPAPKAKSKTKKRNTDDGAVELVE